MALREELRCDAELRLNGEKNSLVTLVELSRQLSKKKPRLAVVEDHRHENSQRVVSEP